MNLIFIADLVLPAASLGWSSEIIPRYSHLLFKSIISHYANFHPDPFWCDVLTLIRPNFRFHNICKILALSRHCCDMLRLCKLFDLHEYAFICLNMFSSLAFPYRLIGTGNLTDG